MARNPDIATGKLVEYLERHFTQLDYDLVKRACAFAEDLYSEVVHPTGISYIQYASEVAKLLDDFGADPVTICTEMIYPPPHITEKALIEIWKQFEDQNELESLVEEILRLDNLEWGIWTASLEENEVSERRAILRKMFQLAIDETRDQTQEQHSLAAVHFQKKGKQLENLIRMFLAEVTDIRALVIKLVDRLHLVQILKYLTQHQQESIHSTLLAKSTLAIYAPLAERLGMWRLKSELEDMSFRLLELDTYKAIAIQLDLKKQERERYIANIIHILKDQLEAFGIKAQIFGRAKHIYSIYQKMEAKQLTFEQINDLLGIRIIVDTCADCYDAQGILHELYLPLTDVYEGKAGRDWIANPKENLYQSLHTTILIEGKAVEVQIRTSAMHKIAEYGVTALQDAVHWRYKESKTYGKVKTPREASEKHRSKQLAELRKILNGDLEATDLALKGEQETVISMLKGLLEDRIFVITPEGHVIDLSAHATPLDFAYRIHTDRGHRYTGAKVGDHLVRSDYELKNGDIVELITSRARTGPSPEWLARSKDEEGNSTYVFARTRHAREKIHRELNKQNPKT